MKIIKISSCIILALSVLSGCKKEESAPIPPELVSIYPNYVDVGKTIPLDTIKIVKGAGDYKIIYPKMISTNLSFDRPNINYSEDLLKIKIVDDNIIVEFTGGDEWLTGYFIITDKLGGKRLFKVFPDDPIAGGLDGPTYEEEQELVPNMPNYWSE